MVGYALSGLAAQALFCWLWLCSCLALVFLLLVLVRITTPRMRLEALSRLGWVVLLSQLGLVWLVYAAGGVLA